MGWSCRVEAGWVIDAWNKACIAQTGSQNVYHDKTGKCFFETSRTEHDDGAITGSIWRFLPDERCRRVGSFRVEGGGTVTRAPAWLRRCAPSASKLAERYRETFEHDRAEGWAAPMIYSPV